MNFKKLSLIFCFASFLFLSSLFASGIPGPPETIKINLSVAASEDYLADRLISHLKRELEYIDGAEIVTHGEDWRIAVIGSKTSSRGGQRGYYSFSVLYLKPSDYRDLEYIEEHLLIDGQPNVKSGARSIVNYFMENCLGFEVTNKYRRH